MPDDPGFPPSPAIEPDDGELQSQLEELKQGVQAMQAEWETALEQAQAAGEAEAERQAEEAGATPEPDAAQLAKFAQMEADYGAAISLSAAPHQLAGQLAREILAVGKVGEELLQQRGNQRETTPRQWYYAEGGQRRGPVSQSELLKMLEDGDLPWKTLVWRKPMDGWEAASDTELDELAGPGKPPPLPGGASR